LKGLIPALYDETDSFPIYEGSVGASPREMRTVLLDAAQNHRFDCLSPFAVLEELDELCERANEYAFLQEDPLPGGYHDTEAFRIALKERLLDSLEDEFRVASGLVDETRYQDLFDRYITHVSYWLKNEKLRNPLTGQYEDPDPRLMDEVETLLGLGDDRESSRHGLINTIAAWVIDHPDEKIDNARVFSEQLKRMRNAVFAERRGTVAGMCRDLLTLLRDEAEALSEQRRRAAQGMLDVLTSRFGYAKSSAEDAAAALLKERYRELIT
jgi:predicted Ser/Thr protein kinase